MCDLSASMKVTVSTSTWACTNGVPSTAICSGSTSTWTGVTCVNGAVTQIDLGSKSLSGSVSSSIGFLTSLTTVKLGPNSLRGTIPTSLGLLGLLTKLNLGTNLLTGTIPSQLGSLTNMNYLHFDNNKLTGSVPSSLCACSSYSGTTFGGTSITCYASCLSTIAASDLGTMSPCSDRPTSGKRYQSVSGSSSRFINCILS